MRFYKQPNGKTKVIWDERQADGTYRQRAKRFTYKKDAERWAREFERARDLGPVYAAAFQPITLEQFLATPAWLDIHGGLSKAQRAKYKWALGKHLEPLLDVPLGQIDVPRLSVERTRMRDAGATVGTRRLVFGLLARVLDQAILAGHIPANVARALPNDERATPNEVQALAPAELEQLLADLAATGGGNERWGRRGHVIALLGGRAGLSPREIRLVPWHAFRDGQLHIGADVAKVSRARPRAIDLDRDTDRALRAWRLESGGRGSDPIVGEMTESSLKQWGTKTLRRHVDRITDGRISDASTYTLRHSHASALHHVAGYTVPTAAQRLGHKQQTHIKHYSHVIESIRGQRYDDLDALIAAAREQAAAAGSHPISWNDSGTVG